MGPDTPPPRDSRTSLTYFTDETLQEKIERHLHDIVEAEVIQRLQASPSEAVFSTPIHLQASPRFGVATIDYRVLPRSVALKVNHHTWLCSSLLVATTSCAVGHQLAMRILTGLCVMAA